jgi:methylmalonyl-CoA decarboxylase subunit alpha
MDAEDPEAMRLQKIQEYKDKFANPYVAAAKGYIDEVIEPEETRQRILHALKVAKNKSVSMPRKKHGIPPF